MLSTTTLMRNRIESRNGSFSRLREERPFLAAVIEELRLIRGGDDRRLEREARNLLRDVLSTKKSKPAVA